MKLRPVRAHRVEPIHAERVIVMGDAHFDPTSATHIDQFVAFVEACSVGAEYLVILGDLFDYWMGPKHLRLARLDPFRDALQRARSAGCRTLFVSGNCDFLMDGPTADALGMVHAGEWIDLRLGAARWLLTHGDNLCVQDLSYMRLRRVTHSRIFHWLSHVLPVWALRQVAYHLRSASTRAQERRRESGQRGYTRPFPIQPEVVAEVLERDEADLGLICGHFHIAKHWRTTAGARFLVLPAFEFHSAHIVLERGSEPKFFSDGQLLEIDVKPVEPGALTYA